jgi:hypothetical protein
MAKIISFILIFLLFIACKKDKKPGVYDVIGSWSLSSYQTNFGIGVNATVTQYPCMAGNILTFYKDSSSTEFYTRNDSCFVTPTHLKSAGAQLYGLPGVTQTSSTWSLKGNILSLTYLSNHKTITGTLTTVNNKLQLSFKDVETSGGNTYFINTTEVKQ